MSLTACCWTCGAGSGGPPSATGLGQRRGAGHCSGSQARRRTGLDPVQDPGGSYAEVDLFKKLYGEGKIKLRIYKALSPGSEVERLFREGPIIEAYGNRLNVRAIIKFMLMVSPGSRSAALLAPYADAPDTSGFPTIKEEALLPMIEEALRKVFKWKLTPSAIAAIASSWTNTRKDSERGATETTQSAAEPRCARGALSQIVNPADIPRFAKLGIIPSMQPSHAIGGSAFCTQSSWPKRLSAGALPAPGPALSSQA